MEAQPRGFWRCFFQSLAKAAGVLTAIFGIFFLISLFSGSSEESSNIEYNYSPSIMPNAQGVRKQLSKDSPVILKLNIDGVIGLESLTRDKIESLLVESREKTLAKDRVKAILLCIDSPGGTVSDADGIYRKIKAYKEAYQVPVYAHVDGLCASGGMYIACSADKIFATETSLIGSVGVIVPTILNFYNILNQYGIETKTLSAGKDKDELNPLRKWSPDEGKNYQSIVDDLYETFTNVVVSNRPNMSKEKLTTEYGAKLFPAKEAKELGYIDVSNASYNEALEMLANDLGLESNAYQVVELTGKNWLVSLFQGKRSDSNFSQVTHRLDLPKQLEVELTGQFLYLYR